jgi:hypothetical protein
MVAGGVDAACGWWCANRHTTLASLERSSGEEKDVWWEWAVAAELFRRAAKAGSPTPMQSLFWRSDKHEVDSVRRGKPWIEVKAGKASPFEFDWFARSFPREQLLVVNSEGFEGKGVKGATLEEFLLEEGM